MSPPRKPPGTAVGHRKHPSVIVSIDSARKIPEPPAGLLAITKAAWSQFWESPTSSLVIDSDLPALHRYFDLFDEHDKIFRAARKQRLVEGSKGQEVLSPLYTAANALRAELTALEDRFGMTPAARLKLGVTFGKAAGALDHDIDLDDLRQARTERQHEAQINAIDGGSDNE